MPAPGRLVRLAPVMTLSLLFMLPWVVYGSETAGEGRAPDRYGLSLVLGNNYDPGSDISFGMATAFGLFDYGKVWRQDRPRELCFKVEGGLGTTFSPRTRAVASLGMLALYYLDRLTAPELLRPYFEAGIGVIYTDFRVEGQGLRFNFNPQLGVGAELKQKDLPVSFVTLRLHHLSNGELHRDNRGVNSLILQVGRFF